MTDHRNILDDDAIDAIWIDAARSLGFLIERSDDAYASFDGVGKITIGKRSTLDGDDCVAQLVFHELCHALTQGASCLVRPDWGLDNTTDDDAVREYACLHLQAWLSDRVELRVPMTPTTVVQTYYQMLPDDPLSGSGDAVAIARDTVASELFAAWEPVLNEALARTVTRISRKVDRHV
jgi:hypothetical protein